MPARWGDDEVAALIAATIRDVQAQLMSGHAFLCRNRERVSQLLAGPSHVDAPVEWMRYFTRRFDQWREARTYILAPDSLFAEQAAHVGVEPDYVRRIQSPYLVLPWNGRALGGAIDDWWSWQGLHRPALDA